MDVLEATVEVLKAGISSAAGTWSVLISDQDTTRSFIAGTDENSTTFYELKNVVECQKR